MLDKGDEIIVQSDNGYAELRVQKHLGGRIYVETLCQDGLNYESVNYITEDMLETDNFQTRK